MANSILQSRHTLQKSGFLGFLVELLIAVGELERVADEQVTVGESDVTGGWVTLGEEGITDERETVEDAERDFR